jgi:hypothetical protein
MTVALPATSNPEPSQPTAQQARGVSASAPMVIDPGWLFIIAGMGLIGSSLLIPAVDSLAEARHLRDRALTIEQHRLDRIIRHEEFLEGLHVKDPTLALSLAASQLNQIPSDRNPMPITASEAKSTDEPLGLSDASVFPALEPPPIELPVRKRGNSLLEQLVLSPKTGLWVGLTGAVCVLIGLLPRARRG